MSLSEPRSWIAPAALSLGGLLALLPFTPAAAALAGGTLLALTLGNPWPAQSRAWTHRLLPLAVVGLG
ncbi:MAG: putative sulfate exporter family transporter, partial [Acidobacteria bacterium]|nr:putative sulfate exporter family transporter [Acidobacteriota bacterium]